MRKVKKNESNKSLIRDNITAFENYKGIGFDVIDLDPIADENLTRHKRLFQKCEIVNLENLELCGSDLFLFSCFPLKLHNCDGSPIRVIAWFE